MDQTSVQYLVAAVSPASSRSLEPFLVPLCSFTTLAGCLRDVLLWNLHDF